MRQWKWRSAGIVMVLAALLVGCATGGGAGQSGAPGSTGSTGGTSSSGGSGSTGTPTGSPIKIGYLGDFAGPCLELAQSAHKAMDLAVADINASGGLLGRPVELVVRDSEAKPDVGTQQMQRLILEDQVSYVVGPCSSGVLMAVSELAQQHEVLLVGGIANTHRATEEKSHDYYVQVVVNTRMEGRAAAMVAADMPYKRWVTISFDYEWGHVLTEAFVEGLKQRRPDVEIVNQYWPAVVETDFAQFITSAMNDQPEAVFAGIFGQGQIAFVRQAAPLGFFDQVDNYMSLVTIDALIALGDELPEGQVVWTRAPFFGNDSPQLTQFVDAYKAKHGQVPDDGAVLGYETLQVLVEGIRRAGKDDSKQVAATMKGMEVDGVLGKYHIRDYDGMAATPVFSGTTAADPVYPFRTFKDLRVIPGDTIWATVEEIEAMRGR